MTRGLAFWATMVVWFIFHFAGYFGLIAVPYGAVGFFVVLFILFGLLGWQVFGRSTES